MRLKKKTQKAFNQESKLQKTQKYKFQQSLLKIDQTLD